MQVPSRSGTPCAPPLVLPSFWERFIVTRVVFEFVSTCRMWYHRKHKLPIIVFYRYMWEKNKPLLFRTIFFNYVLQFVLELLPWWASRRKVGNKLRTSRIKLNHNMVTGRDFQWKLLRDFITKTVLFALLESLNRYVKSRASLENKFEIRRLVLERILYSEIDELDTITRSYSGSLEDKVARDITSTLNFINRYLPSLVSGLYAFLVEGSELFKKRKSINTISFIYPIAISAIQRGITWLQDIYFKKAQKKLSKANIDKLDMAMTEALAGIIDIQTNNLQTQQLNAFDTVTAQEVRNKEGFSTYFFQSLSTLNKMSAFSYVIEIWCVHRIMKTGNLDYKQFSKIQQEIDHVWNIGRRALTLLRKTKHIFKAQSKVVKLLDIRTFVDESSKFKPLDPYEAFNSLVIDNVQFTYSDSDPDRQDLVLNLNTRLTFEPNKKYALLGQNRAGKSTLTKLITKLYTPAAGELYWNGVPYSQLPRMTLRDMISYIPQNPHIVAGTIRENILMGNPHATEAQVLFAAEASGIFDFLNVPSSAPSHVPAASTNNLNALGTAVSSSIPANASSSNLRGKSSGLLTSRLHASDHIKRKKKNKKKNKKKDSDEEDDDDIGGSMAKTLSFAELGEIVQPRGAFFDSGFSKNKYPTHDDHSGGTGYDDDFEDDDDDDWSSDSSSSLSDDDGPTTPTTPRSSSQNSGQLKPSEGAGKLLQPSASRAVPPLPIPSSASYSYAPSSVGDLGAERPHSPADESSESSDSGAPLSNTQKSFPMSASTPNLRFDAADLHSHGRDDHATARSSSPHSSNSSGNRSIPLSASSGNLSRPVRRSRERRAEQLRVLDRMLAAGGDDISGGFAQSIALARVFVRTSAKMVILDESTSQMDPVKLRTVVFPKLLDFVEEWRMCLIVITHHYNAIRDFDHLIVMQEGRVVHEGTHDQLCDEGAEYYLQLNPVGNTLLSYHSTRDLSSLNRVEEASDEYSDDEAQY